jgi:glycerate 2-kinase
VTVEETQVARPSLASRSHDLAPVVNADRLLDHGVSDLRRLTLDVLTAGLRAADPGRAFDRLVEADGHVLRVGGRSFDLDRCRSVVVLGAGKASLAIAAALERTLGDRIDRGLVVRRTGSPGQLQRVEIADASHPVPQAGSLAAGRRLFEIASECGPQDLVITAFTGGSSALASLPPDGVSFEAKQALHAMLLDSGASIAEINTVRKHVSKIKGGRLAVAAGGATIVNLTLSDVVGDATDLMCDPMVQDTTDAEAAVAVLQRCGLWDAVAPAIRTHLEGPDAQSPSLAGLDITTCVLVTGSAVLERMAERVRELDRTPVLLGSALEAEAASLGSLLGALAGESSRYGRPFQPGSVLVAAGGEATVSIHRDPRRSVGCGGPNQEVALAFAQAVSGEHAIAGAFIDSDGSDGGTDTAGGCVDSTTADRAVRIGVDLAAAVAHHDSTAALDRLGDSVVTGATGTNISDLLVVAIDHVPAAAARAEDP